MKSARRERRRKRSRKSKKRRKMPLPELLVCPSHFETQLAQTLWKSADRDSLNRMMNLGLLPRTKLSEIRRTHGTEAADQDGTKIQRGEKGGGEGAEVGVERGTMKDLGRIGPVAVVGVPAATEKMDYKGEADAIDHGVGVLRGRTIGGGAEVRKGIRHLHATGAAATVPIGTDDELWTEVDLALSTCSSWEPFVATA
jgi:hypothetical protein